MRCKARRGYHFVLDDDRAKFKKPWHDPRNGFGRRQARLLDFLHDKDVVEDMHTIVEIWVDELVAVRLKYGEGRQLNLKYKACRVRLRQLKSSTNKRLWKLRYKWRIMRPRNGHLKLEIQR